MLQGFSTIIIGCLVHLLLTQADCKQFGFGSVVCAKRKTRIVGGQEVEHFEMPYMVSLMRRGGHTCGATIIHEKWILTAGHCICNGLNQFIKPGQLQGLLGVHNLTKYSTAAHHYADHIKPVKVNFRSILPHPHYQCKHTIHDIALLELVQPVTFNHHIQPSCLTPSMQTNSNANEWATVCGWGWTHENQAIGDRSDVLRKAMVRIWSNKQCESTYQLHGPRTSKISDTQLCAGFENGGIDACWADSGGPLISKDNVLIGIVSTGIGCARPGLPGIYTRVSKYISWLESVIFSI